jgi:hypothetical protein
LYIVTWDSLNIEKKGLIINESAIPDKKVILNRFIPL